MKTSNYQSWWREMGAISRGMMYLQGNIATPASLDRAEQSGQVRTPASQRDVHQHPASPALRETAVRLYENLLFLGGRPMTAGHNDDSEEPFPQVHDDPAAARRQMHETCATC